MFSVQNYVRIYVYPGAGVALSV